MSKRLTFADGHTLDVSDTSSVTAMSLTVGTFATVDTERAEFTLTNLVGATFDGVLYSNLIPVSMQASADANGIITLSITNRFQTHDELVDAQISELQDAITG